MRACLKRLFCVLGALVKPSGPSKIVLLCVLSGLASICLLDETCTALVSLMCLPLFPSRPRSLLVNDNYCLVVRTKVERYKQLLMKQRDIMIALTQRLNERDDAVRCGGNAKLL